MNQEGGEAKRERQGQKEGEGQRKREGRRERELDKERKRERGAKKERNYASEPFSISPSQSNCIFLPLFMVISWKTGIRDTAPCVIMDSIVYSVCVSETKREGE